MIPINEPGQLNVFLAVKRYRLDKATNRPKESSLPSDGDDFVNVIDHDARLEEQRQLHDDKITAL